jgi:hypothetical protein
MQGITGAGRPIPMAIGRTIRRRGRPLRAGVIPRHEPATRRRAPIRRRLLRRPGRTPRHRDRTRLPATVPLHRVVLAEAPAEVHHVAAEAAEVLMAEEVHMAVAAVTKD